MINEYELRIFTKVMLENVIFEGIQDYIDTLNYVLRDAPIMDLEEWK